ncbi:tyrosine-type recombinase/integrase [Alphaproteobacteria bacterium]|jgi:integrase|nr:tyrosine-type recombinase/integrase [Alphaproteobacteria bacterium]
MVDQINHHLYRKRGFYYFSRRVPKALLGDYPKPRIVLALKTRHYRDALRQSQILSKRLDDQWFHMQLDAMGLDNVQARVFQTVKGAAPLMSEATAFYLRLKGDGKDLVFTRAAQRNANVVIEALGDKPINEYASSEAGKLRDVLLNKGLAVTSIKRMFGSIKAIINLAMAEHGIEGRNPFSSIYMPDEIQEERQPIPLDAIRRIQRDCMAADDEMRWLLALISDTGMRLSEAAGLHRDDIILDAPIPYINLQPHSWRRLKTKGSARLIPLIGASLRAAKRIHQHDSSYAFPRYCDGKICNANSASAALNKWMKPRLKDDAVVHSFRHSMRDRLRAVECPSDIIDQIGGWSASSIGASYGKGYELPVLAKWIKMLED